MKSICIIDFGLGNIKSLNNSLRYIGYSPLYLSETNKKNFDVIFLPGVGSFSKASKILLGEKYNQFLLNSIDKSLIFGICLGMQLFFSTGQENGLNKGLDFIKGNVKCLDQNINDKKLILPNVGFRKIMIKKKNKYLNYFNNKNFYFVHSFFADIKYKENIMATSIYEKKEFASITQKKRIIGTQFHPEKSGQLGLDFLKTVIENF